MVQMKKMGGRHELKRLQVAALAEVDAVQRALPRPLRAKALQIPVVLEGQPAPALINDGLEPDVLGLYVGEDYADADAGVENVPAQIFLYLFNIWAYARRDPEDFRHEVRITYLHELGHFLGLDEDDLALREMD